MRRFLLLAFGSSVLFSPVCTMAHAHVAGAPMAPTLMCEATVHADAIGTCMGKDAAEPSMLHAPSTCADGSCYVGSAIQEHHALSSDLSTHLTVTALPTTFDASLSPADATPFAVPRPLLRAPPDLLSGIVQRE